MEEEPFEVVEHRKSKWIFMEYSEWFLGTSKIKVSQSSFFDARSHHMWWKLKWVFLEYSLRLTQIESAKPTKSKTLILLFFNMKEEPLEVVEHRKSKWVFMEYSEWFLGTSKIKVSILSWYEGRTSSTGPASSHWKSKWIPRDENQSEYFHRC